jgi:DNA-binding NarL/FixJ family response regulator
VLVLTMHDDDPALIGALRAGARGYLRLGADRIEFIPAVLAVAAGASVYNETPHAGSPTSSSERNTTARRPSSRSSPTASGRCSNSPPWDATTTLSPAR